MLKIDGSYGEGGGQIIRTALTLACVTSIPIEIQHIRAGRSKPGLRPQHLTCVQAAAEICEAEVYGDQVGSDRLTFIPNKAPKPGEYHWDIKTAGAATLVMQTILLPLALAEGESEIRIEGGTHVPSSPSAHYLRDVYMPMLIQSGAEVFISLPRCGWYPKGGGEITARVEGWAQLHGQNLLERGELERIFGVALSTRLPSHISQRMMDEASKHLEALDVPVDLRPQRDNSSQSPGAGLFLTAEYANGRAGVGILGEQGLPSEKVADRAIGSLYQFHRGIASVDEHLADQLVLVLALAEGASQMIAPHITEHLKTNCWVINQFIEREIKLDLTSGWIEIAG